MKRNHLHIIEPLLFLLLANSSAAHFPDVFPCLLKNAEVSVQAPPLFVHERGGVGAWGAVPRARNKLAWNKDHTQANLNYIDIFDMV